MNKSNLGSISSSDLIDAKLEEHQICGTKQCPGCGHMLQGKPDWLGLPAGVKFDPTDQELIEHLEAKVQDKDVMKAHPLIDEFIPTIQGEDGICYTHPEKLPGVTRDGLSRHFFHRPSKAYTTGTRKRRKIQTECDLQGTGETRWHKTGKTRPVMVNGRQKGCKKILVLYTNFGKKRKPEKTNWVMHQYHLGQHEEEREGELVVSKIFYQTQPRQCNWSNSEHATTVTTSDPNYNNNNNNNRRDSTGSGSCSSSKERNILHRDHEISAAVSVASQLSSYSTMDITHHFKPADPHHFSFAPFRKNFDQVGIGDAGEGQVSGGTATCDDRLAQEHHHYQQQNHQNIATAAFNNITRPSHPISTITSPPFDLHQTSLNMLHQDSYHISRLMLHNDPNLQQQQQQHEQQHHKMGVRSASGLEELIMGCTSTNSNKEDSSITNLPQEADWMKYSSFWPDPDNTDHHHHHHHHHG